MPATSSTAARNRVSFALDGLVKPQIFLTNWREAARISSSVAGGSKLKRVLIFLHIAHAPINLTVLPQAYCEFSRSNLWCSVHERGS